MIKSIFGKNPKRNGNNGSDGIHAMIPEPIEEDLVEVSLMESENTSVRSELDSMLTQDGELIDNRPKVLDNETIMTMLEHIEEIKAVVYDCDSYLNKVNNNLIRIHHSLLILSGVVASYTLIRLFMHN